MKYLVTGAAGFVGQFLVERLIADGHAVTAWLLPDETLPTAPQATIVKEDLLDSAVVARALERIAPDVIVHLAAQSFPVRSWAAPSETMRINFESTVNLLEALRAAGAKTTRLLFASSSGIYASSRDGSPIPEDAPIEPGSPYAVSKLAADSCVRLYARAFDLAVMCFRPFFLIGPRKQGDAASDIARRIVAIERGAPALLKTGRTDTVRDMIDVRDAIAALLTLAERGQKGTAYNICGGRGVSIGNLIAGLRAAARVPFETTIDPQLLRPVDELVRIGDPGRLVALGWRPIIPLSDTVRDILAYWREKTLN